MYKILLLFSHTIQFHNVLMIIWQNCLLNLIAFAESIGIVNDKDYVIINDNNIVINNIVLVVYNPYSLLRQCCVCVLKWFHDIITV